MRSMTGYGRADLSLPDFSGVIELSSVNKKGFEFVLHCPKEWQFFEKKAQQIIRSHADRGRIRLSILLNPPGTHFSESFKGYSDKVTEQLVVLQKLCEQSDIAYSPTTELIQRIISSIPRDFMVPMLENVEEQLIESTQKALDEMIAMREQEGTSLANDLKTRCHNLRTGVVQIKQQAKGISVEWRDRLLHRLAESGLEIDCENEAVRREFAVYSEKSDISEEITRILSHLEQFESGLCQNQPIGRRLEFIIQELSREFNTLGSKSTQPKVSNIVIDAKVEIEKIREQILNVE